MGMHLLPIVNFVHFCNTQTYILAPTPWTPCWFVFWYWPLSQSSAVGCIMVLILLRSWSPYYHKAHLLNSVLQHSTNESKGYELIKRKQVINLNVHLLFCFHLNCKKTHDSPGLFINDKIIIVQYQICLSICPEQYHLSSQQASSWCPQKYEPLGGCASLWDSTKC